MEFKNSLCQWFHQRVFHLNSCLVRMCMRVIDKQALCAWENVTSSSMECLVCCSKSGGEQVWHLLLFAQPSSSSGDKLPICALQLLVDTLLGANHHHPFPLLHLLPKSQAHQCLDSCPRVQLWPDSYGTWVSSIQTQNCKKQRVVQ